MQKFEIFIQRIVKMCSIELKKNDDICKTNRTIIFNHFISDFFLITV